MKGTGAMLTAEAPVHAQEARGDQMPRHIRAATAYSDLAVKKRGTKPREAKSSQQG